MMTTIVTVLWIATILGFIIYNLYNKNVKLENTIIRQSNFINNMLTTIREVDKTVEKIDSTIWVQSDPELHALFDSVKQIQSQIKDYIENE
jgi:P-type conjugative transfer protein TrbJ